MAKTELKLKTKNAATEQAITTTVGYVNPEADSNTLKTFGQMLNAFTTNTYIETDRVQTINVDTEQVTTRIPGTLQFKNDPTITRYNGRIEFLADQLIVNGETSIYYPEQGDEFFGEYLAPNGNRYTVNFFNDDTNSRTMAHITSTDRQSAPPQDTTNPGKLFIASPAIGKYTPATLITEIVMP